MTNTLKIVIPTAGWGSRMRPQTWSKPKPLVGVAGKTAIDHLLDTFKTVPAGMDVEYILIVGPGLGETQLPPFMQEHYPEFKIRYVLQPVMKGQSDALWLAREFLTGPMVMCFSDTLMETDFSFLADEKMDGIAWVKPVPDPRRFGVAEVNSEGGVTRLVEKPTSLENNRVVIGCYYFRESRDLVSAIEEQFRRKDELKGEYFLTGAINIMLERGVKMRTETVDVWLDTGTIDATLETNAYLLAHGKANKTNNESQNGVEIIAPVFIHPTAEIKNSRIGPYASIDAQCKITDSRVEASILEAGVTVDSAALKDSFIGRQAKVQGRSGEALPMKLNIGDNSSVVL
jgi:glucose-1-phosphate thymidylyltransferase